MRDSPSLFARKRAGTHPGTLRTEPSRPSSPAMRYFSWDRNCACPLAPMTARAMERSKPHPLLRRSAGARLITVFFPGILYPLACKAVTVLRRLSRMLESASPMIWRPRPVLIVVSTVTGTAWMPTVLNDVNVNIIGFLF